MLLPNTQDGRPTVFFTFVKGKPFIDECRRLARQNGTGDILTVALNE